MVWQKVTRHVSARRIEVENKSGDNYPVDTDKRTADQVYKHMVNEKNDWDLWAWVEFQDDTPECEWVQTGSPQGGPPKAPPGEQ